MSRIGNKPVEIQKGAEVKIDGNIITIKGPKGELKKEFHKNILVEINENQIIVSKKDDSKLSNSLHGLTRKLIANMMEGVTKGFEKRLEITGVGYRAQANKNKITLNLGFSHPVEHIAPTDIDIKLDEEAKNIIIITGTNKQTVGEVAAKIRSFRKPEPYKGKGIKYVGEVIARKAGKAAASASGGAGAEGAK